MAVRRWSKERGKPGNNGKLNLEKMEIRDGLTREAAAATIKVNIASALDLGLEPVAVDNVAPLDAGRIYDEHGEAMAVVEEGIDFFGDLFSKPVSTKLIEKLAAAGELVEPDLPVPGAVPGISLDLSLADLGEMDNWFFRFEPGTFGFDEEYLPEVPEFTEAHDAHDAHDAPEQSVASGNGSFNLLCLSREQVVQMYTKEGLDAVPAHLAAVLCLNQVKHIFGFTYGLRILIPEDYLLYNRNEAAEYLGIRSAGNIHVYMERGHLSPCLVLEQQGRRGCFLFFRKELDRFRTEWRERKVVKGQGPLREG